ncbi:MAG: hypothetical protein V4671_28440 [Armatimonadota bacterium]
MANSAASTAGKQFEDRVGKVKAHVERIGLETRSGVLEHNK